MEVGRLLLPQPPSLNLFCFCFNKTPTLYSDPSLYLWMKQTKIIF